MTDVVQVGADTLEKCWGLDYLCDLVQDLLVVLFLLLLGGDILVLRNHSSRTFRTLNKTTENTSASS